MHQTTRERSRSGGPSGDGRQPGHAQATTGFRPGRALARFAALGAVLAGGGFGAVQLLGAAPGASETAAVAGPGRTGPPGPATVSPAAVSPAAVSPAPAAVAAGPRAAVAPQTATRPAKAASQPAAASSGRLGSPGEPSSTGGPNSANGPGSAAGQAAPDGPNPAPAVSGGLPAKRVPGPVSTPALTSPAATAAGPTTAGPATTAAAAGSSTCPDPQYTTSDPTAMWNLSPYFVASDMWGISGYKLSQTLHACSYSDWYVTATMDNSNGDGHVKTYPNSHRDFDSEPGISSLHTVTSTFAETSPGTGIYEDAYDIWLNGVGSAGSTEVMIWTDNHGQTPSGSVQGTVSVGGQSYTVWKTTGNYIAFVASTNFTSGDLNLLGFFSYLTAKGWLTSGATLGQVDYGAELVSTNGVPATFTFSNFAVSTS